ncbi:MAG: formate dehydrogenase accessory sulfurtransferase FdhD [Myxococcota bacterium]
MSRLFPVQVQRVQGQAVLGTEQDLLAVEEPLEIRAEGRPLAVTMRTPGDDLDLVAGFLYTEGVIDGSDDLVALAHVDDPLDPRGNTVDVVFASGVPIARRRRAQRELFASSSCGVCGKASIDNLRMKIPRLARALTVPPDVIQQLPAMLRDAQAVFGQTGGLHAAGLFTPYGELEVLREDIGRHNAVDKVLGWRLRQDRAPVDDRILLVSGRVGFEIVQKAAVARVPVLAAVGAPSSLAAQLAAEVGMTLIGFLRDGRYNRYLSG